MSGNNMHKMQGWGWISYCTQQVLYCNGSNRFQWSSLFLFKGKDLLQ